MKLFLLIVSFGVWVVSCKAEPLYKLDGVPFHPAANIEINWVVAITNVPENLWIYKVVPQKFSMAVLTNILSACHLSTKNRSTPEQIPPEDKDYIRFQIQNENGRILHSLDVAPNLGWFHYENNSWNYYDKVAPAPSMEKIVDMSLDILREAGIDFSLVSGKPRKYTESTTELGTNAAVISARDVFFHRKIDGIPQNGFCLETQYGTISNQPTLFKLEINWRNLSPYILRQTAFTNQLNDFIRNGKSTIQFYDFDTNTLKDCKQLTVTTFFPLYYNTYGFKSVNYVYPYCVMDIVGTLENGNTVSFPINCPLTVE